MKKPLVFIAVLLVITVVGTTVDWAIGFPAIRTPNFIVHDVIARIQGAILLWVWLLISHRRVTPQ